MVRILFFMALGMGAASACSCFNLNNLVQRRDSAEVAFVGRMDSIHVDSVKDYRVKMFFTVSEGRRKDGSPAPKTLTVESNWGSGACGWELAPGEKALVFTYRMKDKGREFLETGTCMFNSVDPDEGELDSLRNGFKAQAWHACLVWPPRKRGGFDEARACLVEKDSSLALSKTGKKLLAKRSAPVWLSSPGQGWIYVDAKGKVVIRGVATLDNGPEDFHNGLVRVKKNGKWGYADKRGRLVIPTVYDGALPMSKGKAEACKGCQEVCDDTACEHKRFAGGQWDLLRPSGKVIKTWADSTSPN